MSISPKTEAIYATKFEQLRRQTAQAIGAQIETSVAPIRIVEFLVKRKPGLAKRSWRLYKAALDHQFRLARDSAPDQASQQEIDYALQILRAETQEGALSRGTRTSARKAKRLRTADFEVLVEHIRKHLDKHVRARALLAWCVATEPVGLRPSEWDAARRDTSDSGTPLLVIQNAKATNGRGNGPTRTLDLSGCTPGQLNAIDELLDLIEGYRRDGGFERFQSQIAEYLYRAARAALSKRAQYPSLYTFRHQFSANAKSHLNPQEVAALMGHGSDATANRNYAQKRVANGQVVVRPIQSEVDTVLLRDHGPLQIRKGGTTGARG